MSKFLTIARWIDCLNDSVGKTVAWAAVVAIFVSGLNALSRRFLGMSSNGWLELQWYLFGAVFLLCAPWTLRVNEHIRIDILFNVFSKKVRDWIELFGLTFFLLPFWATIFWLSIPYFFKSYGSGELSANAGGLPLWPAKGLILLGFALLGLQWASETVKVIAKLTGRFDDSATAELAWSQRDYSGG